MTSEKHVVGLVINKENKSSQKKDMEEIANSFYELVKDGYITEMALCGLDTQGQIIVLPFGDSMMSIVGLIELSKQSLLTPVQGVEE
jgi:hypothetical protein